MAEWQEVWGWTVDNSYDKFYDLNLQQYYSALDFC